MERSIFKLEINQKNVDSAIDFIKVIVTLSTAIIGAFVFKRLNQDYPFEIKGALVLSFISILCAIYAFMGLGSYKGGYRREEIDVITSLSFYGCIVSFFFGILLLMVSVFK